MGFWWWKFVLWCFTTRNSEEILVVIVYNLISRLVLIYLILYSDRLGKSSDMSSALYYNSALSFIIIRFWVFFMYVWIFLNLKAMINWFWVIIDTLSEVILFTKSYLTTKINLWKRRKTYPKIIYFSFFNYNSQSRFIYLGHENES